MALDKKQIAAQYDEFWDAAWGPSDDWSAAGERSLRAQAVQLVTHGRGPVLDIGCGNGLALLGLRRRGIGALGCDISIRALRDAKLRGDVLRADGTCLPFTSDSFRCILLLDALEHVVEKHSLIRECWRALAEDGILILTTPCPKATKGLGDQRQPYDRPATYSEIRSMTDGLFELRMAKGILTIGGVAIGRRGSLGPLWLKFPILLHRCSEVLFVLEKKRDIQRRGSTAPGVA